MTESSSGLGLGSLVERLLHGCSCSAVTANHGKITYPFALLSASFCCAHFIASYCASNGNRSTSGPAPKVGDCLLTVETATMYFQGDMPSSIVMVRLDKSDSRCNVRLKSIVVEVYSCLPANDGILTCN